MAAAAWSWVEKMLQELQVTSAPSSIRVSMSTAVWMVMWRHPAILAPFRGFFGPYTARRCIRPGISFSAMASSLRPQSAREMSATLYGALVPAIITVVIDLLELKIAIHPPEDQPEH